MKLKNIIKKLKEKNEELSYKRKDKMARRKGFSNYESYELQTAIARKEAYEKARKDLRQQELKRVTAEEYTKTINPSGQTIGKINRGINKFNKGMAQFSDMMGTEKPTRKRKGKRRAERHDDTFDMDLGPAPKLNLWGKQEKFRL